MGNIGSIDMMFLDDVFGMGGGYVLNFSDRTFSEFFREELRGRPASWQEVRWPAGAHASSRAAA